MRARSTTPHERNVQASPRPSIWFRLTRSEIEDVYAWNGHSPDYWRKKVGVLPAVGLIAIPYIAQLLPPSLHVFAGACFTVAMVTVLAALVWTEYQAMRATVVSSFFELDVTDDGLIGRRDGVRFALRWTDIERAYDIGHEIVLRRRSLVRPSLLALPKHALTEPERFTAVLTQRRLLSG
jgi:hypothetical protein